MAGSGTSPAKTQTNPSTVNTTNMEVAAASSRSKQQQHQQQ